MILLSQMSDCFMSSSVVKFFEGVDFLTSRAMWSTIVS